MSKPSKKSDYKKQRQIQQEKQQRQMKRLLWITGICAIAIIVVLIVLKPKSAPGDFAYDKLPVLGSPEAAVKIVEFGDYKCPTCQYFSQEITPQLKKDFIDSGKASLYFMNYPFIGPDSYTAALAAQAVFHQNKDAFWEYNDAIYKNQKDERTTWATPDFLAELAQKQGIDVDYDKLKEEIKSETYASEVDEHIATAQKLRLGGTPTIFINGEQYNGSYDYASIKSAVDEALKGEK